MKKTRKVLKPVHPNAGIEVEYRLKLDRLVREMNASYVYFLKAQYRETPSAMAQDASPKRATAIQTQIGNAKWDQAWHAYVDGELLRGKNGVGRTFQSQLAAETAALQAAGPAGILTEGYSWEDWKRVGLSPFEFLKVAKPAPTSAQAMQERLSELGKRWQSRIDESAPKLAEWFSRAAAKRSQDGLRKILRDGGISVEFKMTAPMRDVLDATIHENISLIKSIGSQYHTEVEGMVMRSVTAGRDLGQLTTDLRKRYAITARRAETIALSQNNLATSSFVRVRQQELGLKAKWLHSHGGREPRPTHLANSGKLYDPAKGWFDNDPKVRRYIWPGQLINCRCTSVSVVEGFS